MPVAVARAALITLTALCAGTLLLGSGPWWLALARSMGDASDMLVAPRLLRTIAVGLGVGSLATIIAWPVARSTHSARPIVRVLCLLPVLMPVYLVPGAWRTLLDPSSPLGDWIIRRSQGDGPDLALLVDQSLAILGLAIWTSPLAWGVLASAWRAIDPAEIDALSMLPASIPTRARFLARRTLPAIGRAIVLCSLVMGAQAVPFDLARIDTISNAVRVSLSLARPDEALRHALPWVMLGTLAASGIAWRSLRAGAPRPNAHPRPSAATSRPAVLWAIALFVLGVLLPAILHSLSLRSLGSIARFIEHAGSALRGSILHAAISGLMLAIIAWGASLASIRGRGIVIACAAVFGLLALMPGVLIGAAAARAGSLLWLPRELADSPVLWHVALLARHGVVPCLIGLWMRSSEPREIADVLRLHGVTWRAWRAADMPRHLPAILGTAMIGAALALHEIEVGVMLRPIGTDALAPLMLELLHYQRRDDLAAGVLLVLLPGVALAGLGLLLLLRRRGGDV